ncbi:MAG: amidohydrolase family protein [Opitutaceae bacterium]|nr:amidohydrolase family protein [Opitutaceae bacterium]
MNRRTFLASAGAAAATALAPRARAATPGYFPAIDTHTHFYDPTRPQGAPWPPKTEPVLYRPRYPADFRAQAAPHRVVGTVVVEASEWVEDNQWILDLAKNDESIVGLVGHLVPGRPEFATNLARFAANPLFRGLRMRGSYVKDLTDPAALADLKRVADRDLSIDTVGGAASLPVTLALARKFPSLRVVIDHVPFGDWDANPAAMRGPFAEVAKLPNIFAKISNVVRRVDGKIIDDPAHYRPALDTLVDLFGPDRVFFGSNWPVSDRIAPYATLHRVVAEYFASKGAAMAGKYFWRNSHNAYRWIRRGVAASLTP